MKQYVTYTLLFLVGAVIGYCIHDLNHADANSQSRAQLVSRGNVTTNGLSTYTHPELGLSLEYPSMLSVSQFNEGDGAVTILFQQEGERNGFQIFALPYSEQTITAERIQKDIPSGVIQDPVEVVIGNNIRATVFSSVSPTIGDTKEVWFVYGGYLYEMTTYRELENLLGQVANSVTFKK